MPNINITVQEEVPQELIEKMSKFSFFKLNNIEMMGIDINKIKVKKDTRDA